MIIIRIAIMLAMGFAAQKLRPAASPIRNPVFWLAAGSYFAGQMVSHHVL